MLLNYFIHRLIHRRTSVKALRLPSRMPRQSRYDPRRAPASATPWTASQRKLFKAEATHIQALDLTEQHELPEKLPEKLPELLPGRIPDAGNFSRQFFRRF